MLRCILSEKPVLFYAVFCSLRARQRTHMKMFMGWGSYMVNYETGPNTKSRPSTIQFCKKKINSNSWLHPFNNSRTYAAFGGNQVFYTMGHWFRKYNPVIGSFIHLFSLRKSKLYWVGRNYRRLYKKTFVSHVRNRAFCIDCSRWKCH
jgi:hypothetical protein